MPSPQTKYDAVIVGGGHNGLVCACYLASAGHRVRVLERRGFVVEQIDGVGEAYHLIDTF